MDLNRFEFDYDLTFMVFFLNAEEKIYARYGGRDAKNADSRQSLDGLAYTMKSVLAMHERADKEFAARAHETPRFTRDLAGNRGRGCMHCHQVHEAMNSELKRNGQWTRDLVWRYPLPENLGMALEVDRGNIVKSVTAASPAAKLGLRTGDRLEQLNDIPIHSFADAQLALDRAPATGSIPISWRRDDAPRDGKLTLPEGWRQTELAWRPSLRNLLGYARLYGVDLTADEKKSLGLSESQLAFRQKDVLPKQAEVAGIHAGDIILGVDDRRLEMDVDGFLRYFRSRYLIGDQVTVNLIRDGKRMNLKMTLIR